jgi:hypothetical protein
MDSLNDDVVLKIAKLLDLESVHHFKGTCTVLYNLMDDMFFKCYAFDTMGKYYLMRTHQPSYCTILPWRVELIRIELFQRVLEKHNEPRWTPDQLYECWNHHKPRRIR